MKLKDLIGKKAIRAEVFKNGHLADHSYTEEPVTILTMAKGFIIISGNNHSGTPWILEDKWDDGNWIEYDEAVKVLKLKAEVNRSFKDFVVVSVTEGTLKGSICYKTGLSYETYAGDNFKGARIKIMSHETFKTFIERVKELGRADAKEVKDPSVIEYFEWKREFCKEKNWDCPSCPVDEKTHCHVVSADFNKCLSFYKKHNTATSFKWLNEEKTEFEL